MSNVCALYHIVFCTKKRKNTLPLEHVKALYKYIQTVARKNKCYVHSIGGMHNHVHLVIDLHQDVSLSSLVRDIKSNSSMFLTQNTSFPWFEGWGSGYYAATMSVGHLDSVKHYVETQREHHSTVEFDAELERLVLIHGMHPHQNDFQ